MGVLLDTQYHKLAEECGKQGLWLRAMFEVAYCFGWRSGGLKKMEVSQVNLFDCTLTLTNDQSKNGEPVIVPIMKDGTLYRLLAACVSGKEQTDYLFSRYNPDKSIKDFRQAWRLACAAAGVPDLLFHDLRRTAVTNMERTGKISRKVAMSITGHKTEHVYRRYQIVRRDDVANAVSAIEAACNRAMTAVKTAVNQQPSAGNERAPESTHLAEKSA